MKIKDYLEEKNNGIFVLDYEKYKNKTLDEISEEFVKNNADIFVFLKDNKVKYILTHTDLIELILEHKKMLTLKELINIKPKKIISLKEDDTIIEAYNLMRKYNIEHLIILDNQGNFKGILTYKNLAFLLTNFALKDELTKLYNRRFLDFLIDKYEGKDIEIGVIFIDCDNFKKINDTEGHQKGDKLLKKLSSIIRNSIREIDYAFRYGGDEFIILVFNNLNITKKIANRILKKAKENNIEISIGISHYPTLASSLKEAILKADEDMYKEKKKKRLAI